MKTKKKTTRSKKRTNSAKLLARKVFRKASSKEKAMARNHIDDPVDLCWNEHDVRINGRWTPFGTEIRRLLSMRSD